ncbi:MAG: hypothetical protein ACREJO_13450 [Phycisphaerales bacterium]
MPLDPLQPDNSHEMLDANLRAIAGRIDLPPDPAPDAVASWKQPSPAKRAAGPFPLVRTHRPGVFRMSRTRFALFGSAVAATVALGAVFFASTGGSKVQAATILKSLRARTVEGVRVNLQQIHCDTFAVNGEVRVQFGAPTTIDQLMEAPPDVEVVYAALDVTHDGNALRLEGALREHAAWIFARGEVPEAQLFAPGIRNGVIVDLGPEFVKMLSGPDCGDGPDDIDPALIPPEMLDPAAGQGNVQIVIKNDPDNPGGIAAIPDGLLKNLFSGKAGPDQLKEIETVLNQSDTTTTVQDLGSGQYLLTCTPNAGGERLDGVGTTKVSYTEQRGVEWIEVTLVGEATGIVRIDFPETRIDAVLLDKARLIEQGKTTVIDGNSLKGFFPSN